MTHPTLTATFFVINPYSATGALIMAMHLSQVINTSFNPGCWMRPCSVEIPEDQETADIARELLEEAGVSYHESPWDLARAEKGEHNVRRPRCDCPP